MENTEEKVVESPKYPDEHLQQIEDERAKFLGQYRTQNTLKIVISIICIALIIVAFVVVPNLQIENENLRTAIMIIIAVVALGGTFGYSVFMRKSIDKKMKSYFTMFYRNTNEFVFNDGQYSEVILQEPGKITIDQFKDCMLYKDIVEVGSRGLTEFQFNKIPMAVVDCAGNVKTDKRIAPVFVGKYLFSGCSYTDEKIIAIYVKGNEKSLPPTALEGIKKVVENEKYDIYSDNENWEKTITKEIIGKIEGIQTNENLVDLAISMYSGRMFVMMGYDDPLMVLPLQNEFNSKPYEMYKDNLMDICKLVEALNK